VRKAFHQKRKTLANNLRATGLTPAAVTAALERAGIESHARAEALPIEALAALWHSLQDFEPGIAADRA
jgi:16S rRNA (adenine1518-N6/adenine1519-N6)-dimethyltransferase